MSVSARPIGIGAKPAGRRPSVAPKMRTGKKREYQLGNERRGERIVAGRSGRLAVAATPEDRLKPSGRPAMVYSHRACRDSADQLGR